MINYTNKIKHLTLYSEDKIEYDSIDINNINSFEFFPKEHYLKGIDPDKKEKENIIGKEFLIVFKCITSDNYILNYLHFSYIDVNIYPEFVNKIKFLKILIKFEAEYCYITKELLFELFQNFRLKLLSDISI